MDRKANMTSQRLVIDIGGSNIRFARTKSNGELFSVVRYATQNYGTFSDAMAAQAKYCHLEAAHGANPDNRCVRTNSSPISSRASLLNCEP